MCPERLVRMGDCARLSPLKKLFVGNVYAGLKSIPITCIIFLWTLSCLSALSFAATRHSNRITVIYFFHYL